MDKMFLDVARSFEIAKLVAIKGDEALTDMVVNMWNTEFKSDQKQYDNRVMAIDIFGYDEVVNRLSQRGISLDDNFATYYQLIK